MLHSSTSHKQFISEPVIDLVRRVRVYNSISLQNYEKTCPYCERTYTVGKTGIVTGCDSCEGIIRDPNTFTILGNTEFENMFKDEEGDQS